MNALRIKATSDIEQQIEALVRNRASDAALRLIQSHLRSTNYSESALDLAFESYRRLGLFKIGYALCVRMLAKPQQNLRSLHYWLARFLHLRGASAYSKLILAQYPPETAVEHHFAATIHFSDFNFVEADFHARQFFLFTEVRESRKAKIASLLWADALMGLNRVDEAITRADEVIRLAEDDTLLAIALTAKGEYLARAGEYDSAEHALTLARTKLPPNDFTYDSSLILLWQGYLECQTDRRPSGLKKIELAYQNMAQQNLRPETRLECLRILMELRGDSREDILRLAFYPGVSEGFKQQFSVSSDLQDYCAGKPEARWQLYTNSNEYRSDDVWNYNIPMDLQLAAHLRFAYPHPVPLVRMASLLYPYSPLIVDKFERRIHQLIYQLEQLRGINVSLENGLLQIADASADQLCVVHSTTSALKAVRLENLSIKEQVQLFAQVYGISLPQAKRYVGSLKLGP